MGYADYLETITSLLKSQILKSLTDYIFKNYPGLSFPILKQLTEMAVSKILDLVFSKTELLIYMKHVDLRTSQQGRDFYQAALDNSSAQRNGTDEEKRIAKEKLINSFNTFVRLDSV